MQYHLNDPVAMYLQELARVEALTAAEEANLFRLLGTSEKWTGEVEDAARRVIEANLRLVVPVAERYSSTSGVALLDLIQQGNIGLMNAVKIFAKSPAGEFSARARACIEEAISKFLSKSN